MHAVRLSLRLWTWLALAATLGLALAPTVSRALSGGRVPAPLAHAAAAEAAHEGHHAHHAHAADAGDASPTPAGPHAAHHGAPGTALDHCAMCTLASTAWSLVPEAPQAAPRLLPATRPSAPRSALAPTGPAGWQPGRPRGPPTAAA